MYFMLLVIVYSSVLLAVESLPDVKSTDYRLWVFSDIICSVVFTVEYVLRLFSCPSKKFLKWDFLISGMNVVDVLAIAPFYVSLVASSGIPQSRVQYEEGGTSPVFRILRIIRLARALRVLKAGRYSSHLQVFLRTFKRARAALGMMLFLLILLVVFFAALMFEFEKNAQPDKFYSIPVAMWYCVITMTTVGYGDMFPITLAGKLAGSLAMICGPIVIALPVSIIGAESVKEYEDRMSRKKEDDKFKDKAEADAEAELNGAVQQSHYAFGNDMTKKLYEVFDSPSSSLAAYVWSLFMAGVIVLSTASIILSSMPALSDKREAWDSIETLCVSIFTFDYFMRWFFVPELLGDGTSRVLAPLGRVGRFLARRGKFMSGGFAVIDLLSIIPFYTGLILTSDSGPFAALRVIRLARLVRVFKLGKDSKTVEVLVQSLKMGFPAISMLVMYLAAYLFLFGALMYECEGDTAGTPFNSIPASFWWGMATVTTVGYGDMFPISDVGRLVGAVAATLGLVGMTLPLTIIGVFFAELNGKVNERVAEEASEGDGSIKELVELDTRVVNAKQELDQTIAVLIAKYPDLSFDGAYTVQRRPVADDGSMTLADDSSARHLSPPGQSSTQV